MDVCHICGNKKFQMIDLNKLFSLAALAAFLTFSLCIQSCSEEDAETVIEPQVDLSELSEVEFSIDENPEEGTVIGTIPVTLIGIEGNPVFTVVNQSPEWCVKIEGNQLLVWDNDFYDFETNPQITGTIKAAIGEVSDTATFTINLNDVEENDNPPRIIKF